MKRLIVIVMFLCAIATSCAKHPVNKIEVNAQVKSQNYIGRFENNVSLYRDHGNKLMIQKEQDKGFELFSVDIDKAILSYEYTFFPQDELLYYKQLDKDRSLKVKQLGNSEENNVLLLDGKVTKNIAKNIAYSDSALVSTSPSQRYIVYCMAIDILNQYSMQLYDIETDKTFLLMDVVSQELLNDIQGNLVWAPNEAYLAVSNKQIFNVQNGKLLNEISAESVLWSSGSSKLAYIKSEKGLGKSISILDINTAKVNEVFIVNKGEYLPGYIVWNENETKLAFVTALIDSENPYKAIYSLDLITKEAIRIDTALKMEAEQVSKLRNMHYNSTGNILALTLVNYLGSNLYVINTTTNEWNFFLNIEYLHCENNEDYICNAGNRIYFVQGQGVVELDENMIRKLIHKTDDILEDIYLSTDGSSMITVEKVKDRVILRQLENFTEKSM